MGKLTDIIKEGTRANNLIHSQWQYQGNNQWVFGMMVRGFVREPFGEIYFDEDQEFPWVWLAYHEDEHLDSQTRGEESVIGEAIEAVEKALGIVQE